MNTERCRQMTYYQSDRMSFRVLLCIGGCGVLLTDEGDTICFFKGDCIFFPAASVRVRLHGKAALPDCLEKVGTVSCISMKRDRRQRFMICMKGCQRILLLIPPFAFMKRKLRGIVMAVIISESDMHFGEYEQELVIKNAEKGWLVPFQDVFRNVLQDELRLWKIPGFSIINEV